MTLKNVISKNMARAGVLLGTLAVGCGSAEEKPPAAEQRATVVGYLPTYRGPLSTWAGRIDFATLSHVNIAFVNPDEDGDLMLADTGLDEFVSAAHASGAKVCIAIGGASTIDDPGVFGPLTGAMRGTFIQKISDYMALHDLDCLDVDLEGQGVTRNYEAFITDLVAALRPQGKQVTAAVADWFGNRITDNALHQFDFVNVMAYDLCAFWQATPCQHSSYEQAEEEMQSWMNDRGMPPEKLVLGVPFYGYEWDGGNGVALTYAEIVGQHPEAVDADWIEVGPVTISHNSRATILQKVELAKTYGGLMIWELGQDAAGDASLMTAIGEAL